METQHYKCKMNSFNSMYLPSCFPGLNIYSEDILRLNVGNGNMMYRNRQKKRVVRLFWLRFLFY